MCVGGIVRCMDFLCVISVLGGWSVRLLDFGAFSSMCWVDGQ